jgi:hypothetical protein
MQQIRWRLAVAWRRWMSMSTTTSEVTMVGSPVVDIFDAHTQNLFRRGQDSHDLSSNTDKSIQTLQRTSIAC